MSVLSTTSAWKISEQQKIDYAQQGYLILRNLFTPQEKADLIEWVKDVKNSPDMPNHYMHYEEIKGNGKKDRTLTENFVDHHEQLGHLLRSQELAHLVQQVTGEEMVLFKEKIVYKTPGGGGFPAHTDAPSYQHIASINHLSLAMAVEPATPENGCVEVLPGSHLLKDIPTRHDKCIDDAWCAKQRWIPAELDTGDIFIFSSFLVHRSEKNDSEKGRALIYATFNLTKEGGDQRREYYEHRREKWPATFERKPNVSYQEGYDMYAWGTPMGTIHNQVAVAPVM
ncbi:PhyH-domain-containing protein [Dacryopinax primogenitus]|uniref:PhyH-domain-containing protein n=1 Tax=Dacryopinax primogenitus (strain DJM 731) TaxID=1858805 RepID=M5FN13_DACPD|nr:PhyH-domain-containing protein [Dacryopinax primogenitus]EJT96645.1 PhyH-domain-containing protein [Dacryopinax primogenitus]